MIVVSDTSALSGLAIVNHLYLVQLLYGQLVIPPAVAHELERGGRDDPRIADVLTLNWIEVTDCHNKRLSRELYQEVMATAGEDDLSLI